MTTKYIGDIARRVVHEIDQLQSECLDHELDPRMVRDLHSAELIHYLVRSEHWTECRHCLGPGGRGGAGRGAAQPDPFGGGHRPGHPLGPHGHGD